MKEHFKRITVLTEQMTNIVTAVKVVSIFAMGLAIGKTNVQGYWSVIL